MARVWAIDKQTDFLTLYIANFPAARIIRDLAGWWVEISVVFYKDGKCFKQDGKWKVKKIDSGAFVRLADSFSHQFAARDFLEEEVTL